MVEPIEFRRLLPVCCPGIRSYLRETGGERWSVLAFPFIVIGNTLFATLPGMEFAPLAAAETGADVQAAAQAAVLPWFVPVLVTGGVAFALGVLGFAKGIADSGVLSRHMTWLVVGALVVITVARFVPLGAVQLYAGAAAGIVALWPLAYRLWKRPRARPTGRPQWA